MDKAYVSSTIEALVLASPEPIPGRKIAQVLDQVTTSKVAKAIAELNERYANSGSSFRIRELAGGYQFYILPEYVGFVEELFARRRKMRLTRASLETIAIVAYKQPVTKTEVEQIRGVASDGVIHNLLEKKLISITGRAETVGKPLQYGTTSEFLKFFGLNGLGDLPKMSEIEELIAANEPKSQTELRLEEVDPGADLVKLNVADGTYDPAERELAEDGNAVTTVDDGSSAADEMTEISETPIVTETEIVTESEVTEEEVTEVEFDSVSDDEDIEETEVTSTSLTIRRVNEESPVPATEEERKEPAEINISRSDRVIPTSESEVAAGTDKD